MDLKIIYHYHSGFSVQCEDTLLLFDYWRGENNNVGENGSVTSVYLNRFRHVYVFVSHGHPDHYDPIIETWQHSVGNIKYIISADMPDAIPGIRMAAGDSLSFDDIIKVQAYPSTDLGVSYLVSIGGKNVFHAGDLNLWHWREESTLREIDESEKAFYSAMKTLDGVHMDIAMFPVDPRQGELYDAGANHFIMTLKPQIFIPMHWQDRPEVALDFARRASTQQTGVLPMIHPGTLAAVHYEADSIDIRLIDPPKELAPIESSRRNARNGIDNEDDPFSNTDKPISL